MRIMRYILILVVLSTLPLLTRAEEVIVDTVEISLSRDIEIVDSLSDASSDDVDSVPEWYVAPEIPDSLKAPFGAPRSSVRGFGEEEAERSASISRADSRSGVSADDRAPMRASAAGCLTDSILTFNQDSILTEATTYDYDAAGRTIRTTVWQYAADGSRTGKSKQEYAFDASGTQIYTGTFTWDAATNDWKGTAKSEYVYNEAHKMESNITYTWVNNTWLPSQALTYAYDAAGRETEFTTYARNASLNRLVPSKQRLQTWYNASKKTLEINYTAYANGAWSAGTRKDYDYDANGNQIEYTYYSSYSGGNWVGSTHELWTYNASNKKTYYEKQTWTNGTWANSQKEVWEFNASGKQTLHEKYNGSGDTWTISLQENSGYDAAGNNILVENYSYTNGVAKGSKKEEYTYNSAKKKVNTYRYKWIVADAAWVYSTWAVANYDAAGNVIETANYSWNNNAWKGSGTRTLKTFNSSKKVTEQIVQNWSVDAYTWVNSTRNTTVYSGSNIVEEASYTWQEESWLGISRSDYHYNASNQNDTITTYTNNGTNWIYSNRTVSTYNSNGENILTHNAIWNDSIWEMTSMSRLDLIYNAAGNMTLYATYTCGSDSIWKGNEKREYTFNENEQLLCYMQYSSVNGIWVNKSWLDHEYDAAGNLIHEVYYLWQNNSWIGQFNYEYFYNEVGSLTGAAEYRWINGKWNGESKANRTYDAIGNLSVEMFYAWDDSIWIPSSKNEYQYDVSNRVIQSKNSTYINSTWQYQKMFEYQYENNNIVDTRSYVGINNIWKLILHSQKAYSQDGERLIKDISVSWDTNGVLLTYSGIYYFYACDAPTVNNGSQPRTPTALEEWNENNANYDTNVQPFDPMLPTYNFQGQSVDPATYRGVVIQNGRKYLLP